MVFDRVSAEAARVVESSTTAIFRFDGEDTATVVGRWGENRETVLPVGVVVPLQGDSVIIRVRATGRGARVHDYQAVEGTTAETVRATGLSSSVAAPIIVEGQMWGALAVGTFEFGAQFPDDAEQRLEGFAELISLAIASTAAREQLLDSRRRLVETADAERRRLERNLHDGAQQRLVALAIALRLARQKLDDDPVTAASLMDGAVNDAAQALEELRELARGLHPALLADRGLQPALRALARRSAVPVELDVLDERVPEAVEVAAYYVVSEALTNCVKHAQATNATVSVQRNGTSLVVEIADDGVGGVDLDRGTGLVGMRDRVEALRGRLSVTSPTGAGTRLRAELPL